MQLMKLNSKSIKRKKYVSGTTSGGLDGKWHGNPERRSTDVEGKDRESMFCCALFYYCLLDFLDECFVCFGFRGIDERLKKNKRGSEILGRELPTEKF